ncbi:MAG: molybdopterin-binding protein [Chloroflexi bacterium]|nr:molybdopterin-binding protein [Chloroflexota bacterium]
MRTAHITLGAPAASPGDLVGAILTRDLTLHGERWSKGRRLSAADLELLARPREAGDSGPRLRGLAVPDEVVAVTVIVPEPGDLHEDEAGCRLAEAVRGEGLTLRGPAESRVDLLAAADGVVHVDVAALERFNRIDPLEAFSVFDGQIVRAGDLVASVKVAPHVVPLATVERAERALRGRPLVRVAPFVPRRVGVLVKETLAAAARDRFERSVRDKVEGLGSRVERIVYVEDDPGAVERGLRSLVSGPAAVDLVLTAGGASTDPSDPFFVAVERLGGRVVRHGVPAHPGSMLWLARVRRSAVLGLPSCGAYSKVTAADLLIPRLLSGDPPTAATVAKLGHGGILTRSMRFRFPAYALNLDAPEG